MELYLFQQERWLELYNCNKININDVPIEERYHPINGIIIIILFILFEILYIPCLYSINKHKELSCYKFLFFIGIVDMAMLFLHGLATGIYCFTSEVFCSNPNFNFILGTFGAGN
uniref:G_PROTEIN_RECEP_F1_2 domain-containing protein n=1 Tax=Meloidogyne hapla TaxID=6305 RepID=A0A1I8BXX3_MELHA